MILAPRALFISKNTVQLTWAYTPDKPATTELEIYRSYCKTGGFELVKKINGSNISFIDTVKLISNIDQVFYKLTLIDTESGVEYESEIFSTDNEKPSLMALEKLRLNLLTLRKYCIDQYHLSMPEIQENCIHYSQISYNKARCPQCWDEVRQMATKADCPICRGTGVINPYCAHDIYMQIIRQTQNYIITEEGANTSNYYFAWTINKTIINPGDLIKEKQTGKMFVIKPNSVKRFHSNGYLYRQECSIEEIQKMDKRYFLN